VPLEYEVAQILARRDMAVTADFVFTRMDGDRSKEFSIDIEAVWYDAESPNFTLNTIIECKHRAQNKSLLLIPDPNISFPPQTFGGTLNVLDFSSVYTIRNKSIEDLETNIPYVYKGVEISEDGAFEEQFWHGIQQIRYATPPALRQAIDFQLYSHESEQWPIFFTKILVTNSPLRVLNEGCTLSHISEADTLDDISIPADCAIMYSDYGPEYEEHFRRSFSFNKSDRLTVAASLRKSLVARGKSVTFRNDPVRLVKELDKAGRHTVSTLSNQVFVVTLPFFERFISDLQNTCVSAFQGRDLPAAKSD
jgi:hypothetical protein